MLFVGYCHCCRAPAAGMALAGVYLYEVDAGQVHLVAAGVYGPSDVKAGAVFRVQSVVGIAPSEGIEHPVRARSAFVCCVVWQQRALERHGVVAYPPWVVVLAVEVVFVDIALGSGVVCPPYIFRVGVPGLVGASRHSLVVGRGAVVGYLVPGLCGRLAVLAAGQFVPFVAVGPPVSVSVEGHHHNARFAAAALGGCVGVGVGIGIERVAEHLEVALPRCVDDGVVEAAYHVAPVAAQGYHAAGVVAYGFKRLAVHVGLRVALAVFRKLVDKLARGRAIVGHRRYVRRIGHALWHHRDGELGSGGHPGGVFCQHCNVVCAGFVGDELQRVGVGHDIVAREPRYAVAVVARHCGLYCEHPAPLDAESSSRLFY